LCNFQLILLDFQEEWVLMKKEASFVVLLLDFVNEPRNMVILFRRWSILQGSFQDLFVLDFNVYEDHLAL